MGTANVPCYWELAWNSSFRMGVIWTASKCWGSWTDTEPSGVNSWVQYQGGVGLSGIATSLDGLGGEVHGAGGASVAASLVRPPALGGPDQQQGLQAAAEPLRTSDLPLLPQPGSERSALQFGDWITVAMLMMGDAAGSARGWRLEILREAAALYDRWLTSTPLERIRLYLLYKFNVLKLIYTVGAACGSDAFEVHP